METKLDKLIQSIDPSISLDQVSHRVNVALNSFQMKRGIVKNKKEFKSVLTEFFRHTENTILGICHRCSEHPDIDWGRCSHILKKAYGANGVTTAFEIARAGTEGGIYAVFKAVARQMTEEYAMNEIKARVSSFWEVLSIDEKMAVSKEYLEKYSHLIPSELMDGGAARIRAFFWKVLEEHPRIVRKLRHIHRRE